MKLNKLVEAIGRIKREYGDKEVKKVMVTDLEVIIIFDEGLLVKI